MTERTVIRRFRQASTNRLSATEVLAAIGIEEVANRHLPVPLDDDPDDDDEPNAKVAWAELTGHA